MARRRRLLGWAVALTALVSLAAGAVSLADDEGPDPWQGPGSNSDDWIYDDIDAAYAQAQETGKPILVGFR